MSNKLTELGLGTKLSLYIIFAATVIFAIIFSKNESSTEKILTADADRYSKQLLVQQSNRLVSLLDDVESNLRLLQSARQEGNITDEMFISMLPVLINNSKYLIATSIAYEPYAFDAKIKDFAPYYFKQNGKIHSSSLTETAYPFRNNKWYTEPLKTGSSFWSEPYYEKASDSLMTSFSLPIEVNGKVIAVLAADVSLSLLHDLIDSIDAAYDSYGFIISHDSHVLAHPNQDYMMKDVSKATDGYLSELYRLTKRSRFAPTLVDFDPMFTGAGRLLMHKLPQQGWYLGVMISEQSMRSPMAALHIQYWNWALLGLLACIIVIQVLTSFLLKPLEKLTVTAKRLGAGEFNYPIPNIRSKDEIGALGTAFARMQSDLKNYIEEITSVESAKKAMQQELSIAQEIQLSMVPQEFPETPTKHNVSIYGKIIPAKGVGGDLYDIFWLDEHTLFFTLGDVSGKGIPAALFMAKTLTTIRCLAPELRDPATIMSHANVDMYRNNNRFMFVTIVCGTLDINTGKVLIANAGHLPPLLASRHFDTEYQPLPPRPVLGINPSTQYSNTILVLSPNDKLILYSDGITEALGDDNEMYETERLLEMGKSFTNVSAEDITLGIIKDVRKFTKEHEQSDDMAILVIEWCGHRIIENKPE